MKSRVEWLQAFREYIRTREPIVLDYQYADDYIIDSMKYYKTLQEVAQCPVNWLDLRNHRLLYADLAEAYGLSYRSKVFEKEINKERNNNNGI